MVTATRRAPRKRRPERKRSVILSCEGTCGRPTRHSFCGSEKRIHKLHAGGDKHAKTWLDAVVALIYRCDLCGRERVWGII